MSRYSCLPVALTAKIWTNSQCYTLGYRAKDALQVEWELSARFRAIRVTLDSYFIGGK